MKNLPANFEKEKQQMPFHADWIWFVEVVRKRHFDKRIIKKYFEVLVDLKDYNKKEKKELLHYLYWLTDQNLLKRAVLGG